MSLFQLLCLKFGPLLELHSPFLLIFPSVSQHAVVTYRFFVSLLLDISSLKVEIGFIYCCMLTTLIHKCLLNGCSTDELRLNK